MRRRNKKIFTLKLDTFEVFLIFADEYGLAWIASIELNPNVLELLFFSGCLTTILRPEEKNSLDPILRKIDSSSFFQCFFNLDFQEFQACLHKEKEVFIY